MQPQITDPLEVAIAYFLYKQRGCGSARLAKLVYLADLEHYHRAGETLTGAEHIRDHYGPYCPKLPLHFEELQQKGILREQIVRTHKGYDCYLKRPLLNRVTVRWPSPYAEEVLEQVSKSWIGKATEELVRIAKLTAPFQAAAFKEPIDFSVAAPPPFSRVQDVDWEVAAFNAIPEVCA